MAYLMVAVLVGLLVAVVIASFYKDRRYDKSVPHMPYTFPLVGNLPTLIMNRITSDALTSAVARARKYNWGSIYITVPGQGTELIFNDPGMRRFPRPCPRMSRQPGTLTPPSLRRAWGQAWQGPVALAGQ